MDESGPSTPADLASRETDQPKAPAPDPTSTDPNQVPGAPPALPAPPVLPGATWTGPSRGWTPPGPERPQGFMLASSDRRYIAWIIDWILLGIGFLVVGLAIAALGSRLSLLPSIESGVLVLLSELLSVVYFVRSWLGPSRATLGQRSLKLQVRNAADGRPMTAPEAILRWAMLGYPLAILSLFLERSAPGLLGVAFLVLGCVLLATTVISRTKQGLHDRAARSLVVQPAGLRSGGLLVVALVASLFIGGCVIVFGAVAFFDSLVSSGPNMQSIGFGRGGSECDLTDQARSFPHGVPVRFVMTFSPSLPAGGSAKSKLSKDGTELVDFRSTYTAAGSTSCIHATYPPLDVGHYRLEVTISPSMMPPSSGEFDVTP